MAQAEDPIQGIIVEGAPAADVDWTDEPEKIVKEHITPTALKRLYRTLQTADDGTATLDRAIDKALAIEKRLRKDAPLVGVNIATFDPSHLAAIGEGLRGIFGVSAAGGHPALPEKRPSEGR